MSAECNSCGSDLCGPDFTCYLCTAETANKRLKEQNKKLRECVTKALYYTSMRDPDINTHKQACDFVQVDTDQCLKEIDNGK